MNRYIESTNETLKKTRSMNYCSVWKNIYIFCYFFLHNPRNSVSFVDYNGCKDNCNSSICCGHAPLWSQRIACWSRLQAKAGTQEQIPCKCTALNVVESTMDSATVSRYNKAYNDRRDLPEKKNPLYKSWKYYKDLSQAELVEGMRRLW